MRMWIVTVGRAGQDPWPVVAATPPRSRTGLIASGCSSGARYQGQSPLPRRGQKSVGRGRTTPEGQDSNPGPRFPHRGSRALTGCVGSHQLLSIPLGGLWRLAPFKAWGNGAGPMTPAGS